MTIRIQQILDVVSQAPPNPVLNVGEWGLRADTPVATNQSKVRFALHRLAHGLVAEPHDSGAAMRRPSARAFSVLNVPGWGFVFAKRSASRRCFTHFGGAPGRPVPAIPPTQGRGLEPAASMLVIDPCWPPTLRGWGTFSPALADGFSLHRAHFSVPWPAGAYLYSAPASC